MSFIFGSREAQHKRLRHHIEPKWNKNDKLQTHQTRSVSGRVADFTTREHRQLTLDTGCSFVGWCHDVQCADTFAIQSGVLRETLENSNQ